MKISPLLEKRQQTIQTILVAVEITIACKGDFSKRPELLTILNTIQAVSGWGRRKNITTITNLQNRM